MTSLGPALEVRGVQMRFGPVTALADLSLEIQQGEIHGVVGGIRDDRRIIRVWLSRCRQNGAAP